jgi:hypothetical protein
MRMKQEIDSACSNKTRIEAGRFTGEASELTWRPHRPET